MALSDGKGNDLTFDELYDAIDGGRATLFGLLATRFGLDVGLFHGFSQGGDEQGDWVAQAIRDATDGMRGRERRKYGIESHGLAMLLAYILEAIQQEYWIKDSRTS
jgi:hypothetical protein